MTMGAPRKTVDLEAFLAGLPEAEAAEARAAAARIDELERWIGPPGWIERNFVRLSAVTLVLFVLGIAGVIGVFAGWRFTIGIGGVVLLVSAFPALMLAYLVAVRGRTRLDHAKMALNERHFMPHGGLYFGAPRGDGKVLLVRVAKHAPDLRQRTHAQYAAATKQRWWW